MLKRSICLSTLAVVCTAGVGCAGGGSKMQAMESSLADLRGIQAQQTAKIDELQLELDTIKGSLDEIQFAVLGKTKELEQRLKRFGSRVPPPKGVPADLLNEDQERISRNSGPAAEMFGKGLELVRAGDFQTAQGLFQTFVDENPDTAFSDNALFWVGICLEKQGLYDRAVVSYSEVFQRFPAEDRVPAALFYLGGAFHKMDSNEEAKLTYQKLVDEHPRSSYAAKAKKELAAIRSSSRGRSRR